MFEANSTETIIEGMGVINNAGELPFAAIGGGNSNISLTGSSSLSYPGKPGYKPSLYI